MTTTATAGMAGTATIDPRLLGTVHRCDNLDLLLALPGACIDLIYIDPPFNTGREQRGKDRRRPGTPAQRPGVDGESRSAGGGQAQTSIPRCAEPDRGRGAPLPPNYADCWPSVAEYLKFMRLRLVDMHRVLRPAGSILLHCDWRACHHLRLLLDDVFGPERFVNHLVWSYGLGGSSPRRFARKHDDILFYAKGAGYYFHPPRVPAASARMKGLTKKATDVLDIPSINNMATERTGYPTQKPLALLEVLIEACCPPGGVVGDFFCGSGTALIAAARSGRQLIGCDISADAARVSLDRLRSATSPEGACAREGAVRA